MPLSASGFEYQPAPAAAGVLADHPVQLLGPLLGLLPGEEGPDGLGGVGESRIPGIHLHHREDRGQRLIEGELVAELLLDDVSDHPFGLGAQDVQRRGLRGLGVGHRLEGEEADLRPVAVGDDQLGPTGQRRWGRSAATRTSEAG